MLSGTVNTNLTNLAHLLQRTSLETLERISELTNHDAESLEEIPWSLDHDAESLEMILGREDHDTESLEVPLEIDLIATNPVAS